MLYGSTDPFPCLKDLWSLYSKKGIKTVFASIGTSKSCLADLEIAETLGCPLHVVPISPKEVLQWDQVKTIIKEHKLESDDDFFKGAEEKWVLPKNLQIHSALPWWTTSTLDISGAEVVPTKPFIEWATNVCTSMKLTDSRIDLLKIDVKNGLECSILGAMLNSGIRPACIMVNWEYMPDTHTPTTLAAGHLQMCGYKLMGTHERKFCYYFNDQDMYMVCSWEDTTVANPMIAEVVKDYKERVAIVSSKNALNKSFNKISLESKDGSKSFEEVVELSSR